MKSQFPTNQMAKYAAIYCLRTIHHCVWKATWQKAFLADYYKQFMKLPPDRHREFELT